ncbi:3'(2'),5'-bisphosphate nucleotidase [bacterium]|nr:3'(2'),5'-bisphosphate nucleotidase [bacterium]
MYLDRELEICLNVVRKASSLCMKVREGLTEEDSMKKFDHSPVTVADIGSQVVITMELLRAFPDIPIVAEEDSASLGQNEELLDKVWHYTGQYLPGHDRGVIIELLEHGRGEPSSSGRYWTIDPVDGTKGFLRGDQYAIALALVEDGEVVLGILGGPKYPVEPNNPNTLRGCIFYATRTGGAWMQGYTQPEIFPISVSSPNSTAGLRFTESVESAHVSHSIHARIADKVGITRPSLRMDSQCKYAAVARGEAGIYIRVPRDINYRENIWDHAAGAIIVTEAGGKVTDFDNQPLDFSVARKLVNNRGILATNGIIHDAVIGAVREIMGKD